MLKNYFKTAFRNLFRQKTSSLVNIAGLSIGIACSLVLFMLIKHLATFDIYHTNRDRVFRIVSEMDGNSSRFYTSGIPPALPDAFRDDFPEAEEVTFTSYRAGALIKVPQATGEIKKYQEEAGVVFAQPNFFRIFDRAVIVGDAHKGLDDPNEAIISRSWAKKYFGREEVIGEVLEFDTLQYRITAIMEDAPANTDLPFQLMLSMATIKKNRDAVGWGGIWSDEQCYILLRDPALADAVRARIPAFVDKHLGKENYQRQTFNLQPLSDLHFDDRYSNYSYRTAPRQMLVALAVIAIFLVVTACINFINLTTAEAVKRSKEVGIRKTLGSTRIQLILRFLGETALITAIAVLIAVGLAQMALTLLNPFLDLSLALDFTHDLLLWAFILAVTALVSLLSGLYPSLILSGFKPVIALKSKMSDRGASGFNLRRVLVVVQFVISQFFIMGTIILVSQMNYFQTRELGFTKDAVLVLPIPESSSKMRTLREEISRLSGVESASLSSRPPSSSTVNGTGFYFEGEDESKRRDTQVKQVDRNYISLYGIRLIAGRNLEDYDTARGFLVNEELVRVSGFQEPSEIIGKTMHLWGKSLPVVGVVRDFHTVSLRNRIEPVVLMNELSGYRTLSLKVRQRDVKDLIAALEEKWEHAYPEHIFEYEFLDESIRQFYERERKMSVLLSIFTGIAVFIGCLGLFGLATFMANQKTKEIGVRKALGASVESIIVLFSKEYVRLIAIGFLLAAPSVWFLMNQWLENFAYKITIGPMVFLAGLLLNLGIAILTVGYRSFRAATVNPIESLRYE